jgi:hypothetical protein
MQNHKERIRKIRVPHISTLFFMYPYWCISCFELKYFNELWISLYWDGLQVTFVWLRFLGKVVAPTYRKVKGLPLQWIVVNAASLPPSLPPSLTHSLTPWCRILFEKLIVTQLIKKILLSLWYLSLRVKRLGLEADHSHQSSAQVKNAWSYTCTSPICLHGVMLS